MEKHLILFVITSLSSCNGGRLGGLLLGAHQQIHNKVQEVADVVLGGFNLNYNVHGHHPQPVQQPANQGGETIVVIVEETNRDGQRNHRPYGTPQHGHYPPPNGYNPNNVFNQGNPNYDGHNHVNPNQGHHHNGHRPNQGYNPRPNPTSNYGQGPYQNGDNVNNYGNENSGQEPNIPGYPNQQGQYNNGQVHNQNGQNNNAQNGNMNPGPTGNPTNVINNSKPTANEVKNPYRPTVEPNSNDNYKPTETNNHKDGHRTENAHKNNDNTNKKPEDDGPLFVPLNDYTYGGDKIVINAPKREADNANKKDEESEDDFPIDIRFKDE